ncbi:MAG: SGNH/GDSL hydrolase family protein [Bdellovibrionales bacterium]|nr:SGNH/GDSL hydrolase family protein [Bdellovibrionales bacterium]
MIYSALKSGLVAISLCTASIFVVLGLVEAAFWSFDDGTPTLKNDRPQAYYKPEASKFFQDYPIEPKNTDGSVFRIAVLGDSFTFAPNMQFDDAFPKRLERMLNLNVSPIRAEVFNYGVPGYSTMHEIRSAKFAAERDGADLIIVEITLNDPERKPFRPHGLWKGGTNPFKLGSGDTGTGLLSHSKLANFVATRIHNHQTRQAYVDYYYKLFDDQKNWAEFTGALKSIADIGSTNGAKVVAVIFPLFGMPLDKNYPFTELHTKVQQVLRQLNILTLDLLSAYFGLPLDRMQTIVGTDFHPNEIGHRIAAEEIYYWLAREQLIPGELRIRELFKSRVDIRPGSNDPLSSTPGSTQVATNDNSPQ